MFKETTTHVSAPGRIVLMGEHAADFGEPAMALAVESRVQCKAQIAGRFKLNDELLQT